MRSLFFLLLLSNLVFFSWQLLQPGRDKDELPQHDVASQELVLLVELAPGQRVALLEDAGTEQPAGSSPISEREERPRAESSEASMDGRYCARIVGISDAEDANRLQARLRQAGAVSLIQGREQRSRTHYWVILPPYPESGSATAAAALLKQQGIKDFFIVRGGEYENAVSLGVFSNRERAETRARKIGDVNARLPEPTITTREQSVERFWLSYALKDGAHLRTITTMLADYPGVEMEEIECK